MKNPAPQVFQFHLITAVFMMIVLGMLMPNMIRAFAAMFLATPHALSKARGSGEIGSQIKHLSEKFGVGTRALREHMHNLDLLSDEEFVLSGDGRH